MRTTFALILVSLLSTSCCWAQELVEPLEVRAVVSDGKHNAFTAFVRWKDAYWLAFRKAEAHNSGDGDLIVLRSADTRTWTEALRLDVLPDDRDPQFLATDKRLFLYDPALEGGKLTSFVTYTDDGESWSEPEPVYKPTYIFWKPEAHGDRFYATAHVKSRDGKTREVHLITSKDGIEWDMVSKMRGGNWESETTIHFLTDTRIVGFLRQKYGSPQASLLFAEAPFREWEERPLTKMHFSGHDNYTFDGVNILVSRAFDAGRKNPHTMIYTFDDEVNLTPYCKLPSGGDCSYPGVVRDGDEMLVSYYSSHAGAANIYIARVPLPKPAG